MNICTHIVFREHSMLSVSWSQWVATSVSGFSCNTNLKLCHLDNLIWRCKTKSYWRDARRYALLKHCPLWRLHRFHSVSTVIVDRHDFLFLLISPLAQIVSQERFSFCSINTVNNPPFDISRHQTCLSQTDHSSRAPLLVHNTSALLSRRSGVVSHLHIERAHSSLFMSERVQQRYVPSLLAHLLYHCTLKLTLFTPIQPRRLFPLAPHTACLSPVPLLSLQSVTPSPPAALKP